MTSRATWWTRPAQLGIGIVAYSPLGRGFLTGQITAPDDFGEGDFRAHLPRFTGENFARNIELVGQVRSLAGEKGCTPGQLALAWVLARGDDVVPIPGTKRRGYLEENVAALDVELTDEELARLEEVFPVGTGAGDRYPDMASIRRLDPEGLSRGGATPRTRGRPVAQSLRRTVTTLP